MTFPTWLENVSLDQKKLARKNDLAYFVSSSVTKKKKGLKD
jgi:hypothetical protein